MLAKEKIIKKLKAAYEPGVVNAGQVYKGWDYDGARQAKGWWFAKFTGAKIFLGRSVNEATETIDDIIDSREEPMQIEYSPFQKTLQACDRAACKFFQCDFDDLIEVGSYEPGTKYADGEIDFSKRYSAQHAQQIEIAIYWSHVHNETRTVVVQE